HHVAEGRLRVGVAGAHVGGDEAVGSSIRGAPGLGGDIVDGTGERGAGGRDVLERGGSGQAAGVVGFAHEGERVECVEVVDQRGRAVDNGGASFDRGGLVRIHPVAHGYSHL